MDNSYFSVKFSIEDILQIINKLGSNKAHGHDEIVLECWKYVVSPSVDLNKFFTSLVQIGESFRKSGIKLMLPQCIREIINSL